MGFERRKRKKQIQEEVYKNIQSHVIKNTSTDSRNLFSMIFKIAAVFVVVAGVAWIIYLNNYATKEIASVPEVPVELIVKENPNGVKTQLKLPDGTKVWLNSGSKLIYPAMFGVDLRKVDLEGEAYFDVVRNPSKPFIVNARNVETRVLGTSFNIMAYEKENVAITVTTGKVRVSSFDNKSLKKSDIDLVPDQQASFDLTTGNINVNKIDASQFLAWTEGRLIFDEITVADAATIIERWYGVTVAFDSPTIKNCLIKNEYRNENLVNVLEGFKFILNIDYEIKNDDEVILKGNGCST